jgi:ABC-type transporter Mla subunit MlaD
VPLPVLLGASSKREVAAVNEPRVDVGRSAKAVDWLKAELVAAVAETFRGFNRGKEEAALDGLAEVVLAAYLLARRAGASFTRLDMRLEALCRANVAQDHQLERWYGDMTALADHLEQRKEAGD